MRLVVRSLWWAVLLASVPLLVAVASALGQSDDESRSVGVVVHGLSSGDTVSTEMLSITVEPIGYQLSAEDAGAPAVDGLGHFHIHLDGTLRHDLLVSGGLLEVDFLLATQFLLGRNNLVDFIGQLVDAKLHSKHGPERSFNLQQLLVLIILFKLVLLLVGFLLGVFEVLDCFLFLFLRFLGLSALTTFSALAALAALAALRVQ